MPGEDPGLTQESKMDEREALREYCADKSYNELVAVMMRLKQSHEDLKAQTAEAWKNYCAVARGIIPERMDRDQIQNITVILPDGSKKRLQILDKISVKTPPENKLLLWEWLRDHDAEAIITETVNASTLSSYVGEQMKLGLPYPDEICEVSTYSTASLVKA